MATDLRNTGLSVVRSMPWGSHFCHFYETKQNLIDTLASFFKAELENKAFCLWVVTDPGLITMKEAKTALAQAVPDLDRRRRCNELGADYFLCKSTDSTLLIEIVEQLASKAAHRTSTVSGS